VQIFAFFKASCSSPASHLQVIVRTLFVQQTPQTATRIHHPTAAVIMQSQGGGVPESRYTMSYSHGALAGDGVDMYGHGPDSYVLHHQQHIGHGGQSGMSPTGHHNLGLGSPGQQHHQHTSSKRSADVAGLNLKQDPMVGDVTMSTIGMGHSTMVDEGSVAVANSGGQNGGSQTKKTPPPNGKKTKGRVKIKMEFIDNKLRRYTTFSKRKTGIMKKVRICSLFFQMNYIFLMQF
jgi:hypothetical protein